MPIGHCLFQRVQISRAVSYLLQFTFLLSFVGRAALAHPPGEAVEQLVVDGLFDQSQKDTVGLHPPAGSETFTIFRAGETTNKFNNHPQIIAFKGDLYATWQTAAVHEDTTDSCVYYSRSSDGRHWSEPVLIGPPMTDGRWRACGGWWATTETLVCYMTLRDSAYPGNFKTTEFRTSTDGRQWSDIQMAIPVAMASEGPEALPDGRLIMTCHGPSLCGTVHCARVFYTDSPSGTDGWREAFLPQELSILRNRIRGVEPSWFRDKDSNLHMVFRDTNKSHRLLHSISKDRGETWSLPKVTNMPDCVSMQCCGNLPDGTAYMVNNPVAEARRIPLAVTLSDDGMLFDRSFLVRGQPPERRFEGRSKTLGYSYPGATVWRDYLWIAYAVNKEDIEVTRMPLAALRK